MKISIKTLKGTDFQIDVEPSDTVIGGGGSGGSIVSGGGGAPAAVASSPAEEKKEEVVEESDDDIISYPFGGDDQVIVGGGSGGGIVSGGGGASAAAASSPAEEKKEEVVWESDDDILPELLAGDFEAIFGGVCGGGIVSGGGGASAAAASSPAEEKKEEVVEESDDDILPEPFDGDFQVIFRGVCGGGIVSGGGGASAAAASSPAEEKKEEVIFGGGSGGGIVSGGGSAYAGASSPAEEKREEVVEESDDDIIPYLFGGDDQLHHIMGDAGFQSLFVVLCYEDGAPYICSIVKLGTQDTEPKYVAHVKQPQGLPPCRWLFSPIPSTYDLCLVPAWYPDNGIVMRGARFYGSPKSLQPISPSMAQKFGGHVVTVRRDIYFMAHPYAYSLIPGGHAFERYIPDDDLWEDLPFPKEGLVPAGPKSTIGASAVWDDHTILLNIGGCQIWAYHVDKFKWFHVSIDGKNNNRCYDIVGEGFVVNNIIYALSKQYFEKVLALTIQKKEVDGDLQYSCSLRCEIYVPAMKQIQDENAYHKTRHFVHLGEDNFCLVQSCEYRFDIECQPIHLTSLKLMGEDKMVVTNECIHSLSNCSDELFHGQFRVGLCFSQPEGMTTASAFKQGETRFLFDPCGGSVSIEDDITGFNPQPDSELVQPATTVSQATANLAPSTNVAAPAPAPAPAAQAPQAPGTGRCV